MTDSLPEWTSPYTARRVLWQQYGVPFDDIEITDVVLALRIAGAEISHENHKRKEANRQG